VTHPTRADLGQLIDALRAGGVEFIVVGGAAAVLHGAPTTTFDLDIVHRRTDDNVQRLLAVLTSLDAFVREPGNRRLRPDAAALSAEGQLLLTTALGPLDVLGVLHDGRGFDQLVARTTILRDERGALVVLDLEALIEVKLAAGRAKDKLLLPILLALKNRR